MNKKLSKVLMVLLVVIITLSSVPINSVTQTVSGSPFTVVAQAASKTTHLNKTKKSIYIGRKYTLKLIDKNGKTIPSSKVKWSRSNKTVASVSKSGVVTGKKTGKIKITATYKSKKYTAVITVKSAVSVSKSTETFKPGETAKKTIKVTCKDGKGIKWKTVEGSGIVKLSQAKKWSNDTKNLYITPTGKKFGTVKIKIYSVEDSRSYTYLTINVKNPYTLEIKKFVPCIIQNYKSQEDFENVASDAFLMIRKVTYKTPDTKTLDVTVEFEAGRSKYIESYYFIKYRVFDKDGFLVESDYIKSKLMMEGDKAKAVITLKNLENGAYTIEFRDYIANNPGNMVEDENDSSVGDNITDKPSMDITGQQALEMYQKAAKDINERGVAAYSKKAWQSVDDIQFTNFAMLAGTLTNLIEGYLTDEESAENKYSEKGSDDAKNRMPISDCSAAYIKSVTAKTKGENYIITIVMKDHINPSYDDADGLAKMSKDFLDYKDVVNVVETDQSVSNIVSDIDGEINYKDYTIIAEMTKDGKFVEISHYGVGYIDADLKMTMIGTVGVLGAISFNSRYCDFKY